MYLGAAVKHTLSKLHACDHIGHRHSVYICQAWSIWRHGMRKMKAVEACFSDLGQGGQDISEMMDQFLANFEKVLPCYHAHSEERLITPTFD